MFFLQQADIDSLLVNICMEAVFVKEHFNINWVAEGGMIGNIEHVVKEYKQSRGLLVSNTTGLGSYYCDQLHGLSCFIFTNKHLKHQLTVYNM